MVRRAVVRSAAPAGGWTRRDAAVREHDDTREVRVVTAQAHLLPVAPGRHEAPRLAAGRIVAPVGAAWAPRAERAVPERDDLARGVESPELDQAGVRRVPAIDDRPAARLAAYDAEGPSIARPCERHGA